MKKTRKALIIFACLFAILLYSSQAIHRLLMPKVKVATAMKGNLTRNAQILEQRFLSDEFTEISRIQMNLIEPQTSVQGPKKVEKGDALASFSPLVVSDKLMEAEKAYAEAEDRWSHYRNEFARALDAAKNQLETAQEEYDQLSGRRNEKRLAEAQQALEEAETEVDLLENKGIYQGTTLKIVEAERSAALERLKTLQWLETWNYQISAPVSGIAFSTEEGWIILEDNASWQVELIISEDVLPEDILLPILISEDYRQYRLQLESSYKDGEGMIHLIGSVNNISPDRLRASSIQYQVAEEGILVPIAALVNENMVYAVETRWDNYVPEYHIKSLNVTSQPGDQKYAVITSGISAGTKLAVGWDRTFKEGEEVIVDSGQ